MFACLFVLLSNGELLKVTHKHEGKSLEGDPAVAELSFDMDIKKTFYRYLYIYGMKQDFELQYGYIFVDLNTGKLNFGIFFHETTWQSLV